MLRLAKHQLAWLMPLVVSLFGLTAPHTNLVASLFIAILVLAIALDMFASPDRSPPESLPSLPFQFTLYGLSALHLANLALLIRQATLPMSAFDWSVGIVLCGTSAGYTAIVLAHELVHRPQRHLRNLGRLLLATVLYEHFYTEHIRGHHVRVGTHEDPATARFGEAFYPFLRRTIPGQFRSAWALETKRTNGRLLRNRVLHGLMLEWGFLVVITCFVGPFAGAAWALQAAIAVLLLESVNFFEHWGIQRQDKRVRTVDSWDTDSWFTYYSLIGLSRHADHHAHAARPYPDLRSMPESPKLPWGYYGTAIVTIFANQRVRRRLEAELRAKQLGPFAPNAAPIVKS